ncbi:trypsin-1-like [Chironomus tepperi]|uniref:trypsin-1-like n=1 Tax=Chironomus tepperi TaxID=113505 RepID=UPI00391F5E47
MIASKLSLVILTIVIAIQLSSASERISARKCKEYESLTQTAFYIRNHLSFPVNEIKSHHCLHESVQLVIGGTNAMVYEFPHQALLGFNIGRKIEWSCGGSILSPNFILTASHCLVILKTGRGRIMSIPVTLVKVGMLKRLIDDTMTTRTHDVAETFQHPNYDRRTINNDIALIRLKDNIEFSDKVYPICLPLKQHDDDEVIVTGFGRTSGTDAQSDSLLKVGLQRFNFTECQRLYRMRKLYESSMLCYGHRTEKKDACQGDSGGPAQVLNDAQSKCTYTQIGVVSFGPNDCGQIGMPGVFANVFNYLDWIEGIVWKDEV